MLAEVCIGTLLAGTVTLLEYMCAHVFVGAGVCVVLCLYALVCVRGKRETGRESVGG